VLDEIISRGSAPKKPASAISGLAITFFKGKTPHHEIDPHLTHQRKYQEQTKEQTKL
jgi:hypothetical protein